ncbi:MAG: hypothetical protein V7676_06795 [Parasphingorhabdus sp.]|uniref:hypothetical protein n=1 Tax=Parasphingorhabdus sp. TaxID=2709688 RepID=UPI0030018ADA
MVQNSDHPKIDRACRELKLALQIVQAIFRQSLGRIVSSIVTTHLNCSKIAREYRYHFLKRSIISISRNPNVTIILVIAIYSSAIILGEGSYILEPKLSDETLGDLKSLNLGILGVQAALVGLVFPFVIAFVGLLNQSRSSFATRLTIFIESTDAIFVGLSSIFLCLVIGIQLPFTSKLTPSVAALFSILNLVWFAANIVALSYFVLRTIAFMHPARRAPLMRAYVTNVVWPRELTKIVTRNRWDQAATYEYLPEVDDKNDIFEPRRRARIWYGPVDYGEPQVMQQLWRKKSLVNVRMAILKPIIQNWMDKVNQLDTETEPDFVIAVEPGREYEGDVALARATTSLGIISIFGIWCSFTFRTIPKDHGAVTSSADLLHEMVADLISLVDGRQVEEFSTQLREVIDFHFFLYGLAQSPVEDFNYALIGPNSDFFGSTQKLGRDWVTAYRDLVVRAAERLFDEPGFFGRLAHTPASIMSRASSTVTPKALQPLLLLAYQLFHQLMEQNIGQRSAVSAARREEASTASSSNRDEILDGAWRDMAAGWERLLQEIATRNEKTFWVWSDFQRISGNVVEHLSLTTEMIGRAVWRGDEIATRWTSDLLLHWRHQSKRAWESRGSHASLESEVLTLTAFDKPWDEVQAPPLGLEETNQVPALVFGAIIHNAWLDHLITIASLSIHWAIYGAPTNTTPALAARMLLQDQPLDQGDIGHQGPQPLTSADVLMSILRITGTDAHFENQSYSGVFDNLLERLGRLGSRPSVSMRIYSYGGGLSFDALTLAQVLTIMGTMTGPSALNGSLRRQLTQRDHDAHLRRKRCLKALIEASDAIDEQQHGTLLGDICDLETVSFEMRLADARQLLGKALEVLLEHRVNAIKEAQIDPGRIRAVTLAAAEAAFKRTRFPINLFDKIQGSAHELEAFTLRVEGQDKGSYTDPPMGNIVINEDDWWSETMSERIASIVWMDSVKSAEFQALNGRNPEDFWRAVRDGSARIKENGHDPVLVVTSTSYPKWLDSWRWPYGVDDVPKPNDLTITHLSDQVEGYAFSMNDIPVFEAPSPLGQAFLFPRQMLAQLRYHDYGDEVPLKLEFLEDEDDPLKGTTAATFQRSVELVNLEAFSIRFADKLEKN